MAQPTTYTRQADFSDFSTNYPTTPHSGVNLDAEFDAVRTTLLAILVNLALIQRDDGDLANGSVGIDQLASDVEMGFRTITNWTTTTDYRLRDGVFKSGILYRCIVAHTAGTFSTDLAAAYWTEVYDFTTAAGYVIGTDIQAWDQQLDDIAALTPTDSVLMVGNGTTWVGESGATLRASLGLTIGTHVQAYNAALASIAGLTTAADKMIYATGSNTYAVIDLTAAGRALLDDADATAQVATLGFTFPILNRKEPGAIGETTADAITGTTITATTEFRGPILTSNAASAVAIKTSGGTQLNVAHTASAVEYLQVTGAASGGVPTLSAAGASTNLDVGLAGKGTGGVRLSSNFARYLTVTGSAGSAVTLTASDGQLVLQAPGGGAGVQSPQTMYCLTGTAIPAGGTAGAGFKFSSTANFGVFFGSGAPSLAAAKGSLYLRSDGSTTNDRAYTNTDGSTTWTALTTAA